MTRLWRLVLIGVLAGTLGLVGCGDDGDNGGGGSGGSGGSAGNGGSGGGEGGSGGGTPLEACSEGPLAETGQPATGALSCVATLPFDLTVRFNATPVNSLQEGSNEFELQMEVAIDADTVNEVLDLAPGVVAEVTSVVGSVNPTAGDSSPASVEIDSEGVPCELAFVRDEEALIVTTVSQGSFDLDTGSTLELTLDAVTQEVIAVGIPVTLTTEGEEPSCTFVGDLPSVSFSLPQ